MMTIREFLALLFGTVTEGVLEIAYLAPKEIKLYPHVLVDWYPCPLSLSSADGAIMNQRNQTGYGVSFGPVLRHKAKPPVTKTNDNGKQYTMTQRGTAGDAHILTCFWADVDVKITMEMSADDKARVQADAMAGLQALAPSVIVASGGGYHGYWLLDAPHHIHEVDMLEIKWALKGIAKQCGGDEAVAELARIMRLPGTINTKPNRQGFRAEVVYCDPTVRYAYADIIAKFSKHGKPPEAPVMRTPAGRVSPIPKWVENYLATGASEGSRNNTLLNMACSLKGIGMSEGEAESLLLPRAQSDGLSEREAKGVIKSAYRRNVSIILPREQQYRVGQMRADDHLLEQKKRKLAGGGS